MLCQSTAGHGDVLVAVATLAAAFAGTFAAFLLESRRRTAAIAEDHIGAVNRALYALFHYWNVSVHFRRDVIDPVRMQDDAWLNASASAAPEEGDFPIDNGKLDFLLSVGELADLFAKLQLQEQRFQYATFLMNERTRCVRIVFRIIGEGGIQRNVTQLSNDQWEGILGADRVLELRILWNGLVSCIDESIPAFESTFRTLKAEGAKLYPKANLIDCNFTLPPNIASSA